MSQRQTQLFERIEADLKNVEETGGFLTIDQAEDLFVKGMPIKIVELDYLRFLASEGHIPLAKTRGETLSESHSNPSDESMRLLYTRLASELTFLGPRKEGHLNFCCVSKNYMTPCISGSIVSPFDLDTKPFDIFTPDKDKILMMGGGDAWTRFVPLDLLLAL